MPAPLTTAIAPPYPVKPMGMDLELWPSKVYKALSSQDYLKSGVSALVETYTRILEVLFPERNFVVDELHSSEANKVAEGLLVRYCHAGRSFPVMLIHLSTAEVRDPFQRRKAYLSTMRLLKRVVVSYQMARPDIAEAAFPLYVIGAIGYDACVLTTVDGSPEHTFPGRPGLQLEEIALDWYRLNVIASEAHAILHCMAEYVKLSLEEDLGTQIRDPTKSLPSLYEEYWSFFLPKYESHGPHKPQFIRFPIFDDPSSIDRSRHGQS